MLLAVAATILWAAGSILTKHLLHAFAPLPLLVIELAASSAVLWGLLLLRGRGGLSRGNLFRLAAPGLLQPGLTHGLSFLALRWTAVSIENVIWSSESVLMLLFAYLFLRERFTPRIVKLAFVAFAGIAVVSFGPPDSNGAGGGGTPSGIALILLAVVCACWYTVLTQKDLEQHHDPLVLAALQQVAGLLLIAIFTALAPSPDPAPPEPSGMQDYILAAIAGVSLFALPFWLYLAAMRQIGSGRASQFLPLSPIFTILAAGVFLGERLSPFQLLGAAVTLASVGGIAAVTARP